MNVKMRVVQGRPAGKSLVFGPGDYYLGRGGECHVRFDSDWVSRQHCLLQVGPEGVRLRDLGSRNGTLVNGQLLSPDRTLLEGDQVQIGPVVFEVGFETPPAAARTVPPVETVHGSYSEGSSKKPTLGSTAQHPVLPPEASS